jgi:hypothetical protein
MRLVMDELNHHAYAADLELFEQMQLQMPTGVGAGAAAGAEARGPGRTQRAHGEAGAADSWVDAFPYSRGSIRLTLPELRAFFEEYIALLNRYKRPDGETPDGARTVLTRLLAFPAPARPDDDADDARPNDAQATARRAPAGGNQTPTEGNQTPTEGIQAPAEGIQALDNTAETDTP